MKTALIVSAFVVGVLGTVVSLKANYIHQAEKYCVLKPRKRNNS